MDYWQHIRVASHNFLLTQPRTLGIRIRSIGIVGIVGIVVISGVSPTNALTMEFILSGRKFNITPGEVERKMQGREPEVVHTHAVKISGKRYPVKQVMSVITGLSKADFNSHQAHQVLRRIGLSVVTAKGANG
jgi:hypothetical protein